LPQKQDYPDAKRIFRSVPIAPPGVSLMLEAVKLSPNEIAAGLVAISFAAGLNVYATLATLGLLTHAGILPLPPALHIVSTGG